MTPRPKPIKRGRTFNHRDGMSELERFEMDKEPITAEQWVNKLESSLDKIPWTVFSHGAMCFAFKKAMDAARAEGWHDGFTKGFEEVNMQIPEIEKEARAQGFAEGQAKLKEHWFGQTETDWGEEIKAQGFIKGLAAMQEKVAKMLEAKIDSSRTETFIMNIKNHIDEIRALLLSEAEGGKSE